MWAVHHLFVVHRVWTTQNHSWALFPIKTVIRLARLEQHAIKFNFRGNLYPYLPSLELWSKQETHLLSVPEEHLAKVNTGPLLAPKTSSQASGHFKSPRCSLQYLAELLHQCSTLPHLRFWVHISTNWQTTECLRLIKLRIVLKPVEILTVVLAKTKSFFTIKWPQFDELEIVSYLTHKLCGDLEQLRSP